MSGDKPKATGRVDNDAKGQRAAGILQAGRLKRSFRHFQH